MTAPLETQYRRLLAFYPAAHRRAYEEEMVTVLMEGAEPGQHRPTLADAADLLWSGLRARLGQGFQAERGAGWRDAAAVVGLLGVVLLAAVAARRLIFGVLLAPSWNIRAFGLDGGLYLDVTVRSAAWLAVLIAVVVGLRRSAVVLGAVGLLVEVAAIVIWLPRQEFRLIDMSWVLAMALLTVTLLAFSRSGRSARAVLGWRGTVLIVGAGALAAVAVSAISRFSELSLFGLINVPQTLALVAVALLGAAVWSVRGGTRRRVVAWLVPLFTVPVAQQVMEEAINIYRAPAVTPGIVATQVVCMVGVPMVAFGLAIAALYLQEHFRASLSVTRV
jgi:hypothetical protein